MAQNNMTIGSRFFPKNYMPLIALFVLVVSCLPALAQKTRIDEKKSGDIKSLTQKKINPVVIELFTSQGCSSCPKADKIFQKITNMDNVIALSFHVDYWDYLGWKDKMASPVHTKRQRTYAKSLKARSIFTPQVIIGGKSSLIGQNEKAIYRTIRSQKKEQASFVPVKLWENEKSLFIEIEGVAENAPKEEGTVWLALIKKSQSVKIRRGENRGKTITYHNIVHELSPVGRWMGEKMTIRLPRQHLMQRGSDGCVVLLQADGNKGNIRGAAQMASW